jgi:hypothetical protein
MLHLYRVYAGSLEHLLQYETERQRSNVPAMAAAEGLNWLYTSSLTPFTLLRSIGLNLTNAFPPVKVGKIPLLLSHTIDIIYLKSLPPDPTPILASSPGLGLLSLPAHQSEGPGDKATPIHTLWHNIPTCGSHGKVSLPSIPISLPLLPSLHTHPSGLHSEEHMVASYVTAEHPYVRVHKYSQKTNTCRSTIQSIIIYSAV